MTWFPITSNSASQKLTINLIWDQSVTTNGAPAGFKPAVTARAQAIANMIVSNLTINVDVGFGGVGGTATTPDTIPASGLAMSWPPADFGTVYTTLRPALISAAKSTNALNAVATLPASDPSPGGFSTYKLSQIQAYGLGLRSQPGTGTSWIGFSTSTPWNYTGNPGPSEYDFNGAVDHELTELLGRVGWQDNINHIFGVPDLYRYSALNTRQWAGGLGYFSIDSGATNLHTYSAGAGIDTADWSGAEGQDGCNSNFATGSPAPFSTADIIMLDVLGWSSR